MTTAGRRGVVAVLTAALLLSVGAMVAVGVDTIGGSAGRSAPQPAGQPIEQAMVWVARVLLVAAVLWLLIGIVAARTRLVRRPGAAAARALWIASTRPWRARESTLGMLPLDRWLTILVPGALLVATRVVQTSFLGWLNAVIVFGAWLVFAVVVRIAVGRRSPWPVIAAAGGVVVARCILVLGVLSWWGSDGSWADFWTDPVRRGAYVTVAVALFGWVLVAAGWALVAQFGVRRAIGAVLAAVGAALALPAVAIGALGLEPALSVGADELGIVPPGLTIAFGMAGGLDIVPEAAWIAAGCGVLIALVGVVLVRLARAGGDVGGRS